MTDQCNQWLLDDWKFCGPLILRWLLIDQQQWSMTNQTTDYPSITYVLLIAFIHVIDVVDS